MSRSEPGVPAGETDLLNGSVSKLREGLRDDLVAVVLFGSQAREEAREGSDWDILVVARLLPGRTLERAIRLKRMLSADHRGEVSLLAKTPEEFMSNLPDLCLDIVLDGVVLYDTDDFMAKQLWALKALIRRKGLRREREGGDLIWRWPQPPSPDWSLEWEEAITGRQHATYRLKLAQGFLEETRQDTDLSRWRSSVDSAQPAVENAGKTGDLAMNDVANSTLEVLQS